MLRVGPVPGDPRLRGPKGTKSTKAEGAAMEATMRATGKRILCAVAFACAVSMVSAVAGETLQVWAIGLPNGYVVMEHQAPVLEVSADDVANGMIEVRGGSRL